MKNLIIMFALFFSVFLFSCNEKNEEIRPMVNSYPSLIFNSFFPNQAQGGDDLIISVSNFRLEEHTTYVTIGNAVAEVVATNEYTIVAKIPNNLPSGSYPITIHSNGQTVTHDNQIFIFNNRL